MPQSPVSFASHSMTLRGSAAQVRSIGSSTTSSPLIAAASTMMSCTCLCTVGSFSPVRDACRQQQHWHRHVHHARTSAMQAGEPSWHGRHHEASALTATPAAHGLEDCECQAEVYCQHSLQSCATICRAVAWLLTIRSRLADGDANTELGRQQDLAIGHDQIWQQPS